MAVATHTIDPGDGDRKPATIHFFADGVLAARLAIPADMSAEDAQRRVDAIVAEIENPSPVDEPGSLDQDQITALELTLP